MYSPSEPFRGRSHGLASLIVLGMALFVMAGCTRALYRCRADKETYGLIGCATQDPRWPLADYTIQPKPASRYFDPNDPDHPPMPPDDPVSHRLMHCVDCKNCVDCKRGACCWHHNGDTPSVENPAWRNCLPYDQDGAVALNRQMALQIALVNSREYQLALEELYLSGLNVTFQRFQLDTQFFGGNSTFFTAAGPLRAGGEKRQLRVDDTLRAQRLLAGGGELIVGAANSLVWEFTSPQSFNANTLLNFSLLQPLLRGAGRAVVLESLTQSERELLANVRQLEYFRHGFYVQIVAGRTPVPGPVREGLTLTTIGPTTQGATGGILGLLSDQVRIRNQRANVAGLRDSLDQIEAHYGAGRIDRLQVDQARQALFSAQRNLLALETGYGDRLDAYKLTLGMPPDLNVRLDDPVLAPLVLIDPKLNTVSDATSDLLDRLRTAQPGVSEREYLATTASLAQQAADVVEMVRTDLQSLAEVLPTRREELRQLASREELHNGDVDPRAVDIELLNLRVATFNADFVRLDEQFKAVFRTLETFQQGPADVAPQRESLVKQLQEVVTQLSDLLLGLSLVQARVRLETLRLVPVSLDPAEAFHIACENRLDWMNARAALVDRWRQIRVVANALRSDLNVLVNGEINTIHNNPVEFASSTGQLRLGLQFDPPLTRLAERNAYREVLIDYQRARRTYYAFEDRVNLDLRSTLRTIRQTQLDFELRRVGVHVAISQVDITRERLQQPPKPGQVVKPGETPGTFGATTVRDLTQAYSTLLTAQNDLLAGWVDYEVDRLNLDLSLGTMQLDACGAWIDPGPVRSSGAAPTPRPEEVPLPEPGPIPPPPAGS